MLTAAELLQRHGLNILQHWATVYSELQRLGLLEKPEKAAVADETWTAQESHKREGCIDFIGAKRVAVRSDGREKRGATALLSFTLAGERLKPFIILAGEEQNIEVCSLLIDA